MSLETFVQYFLLFAIVFDASIAWFVLLKNPRRPVNQAYFFMIFWVTVWQVANYKDYISSAVISDTTFSHISFFAAAFIGVSLVYLSSIFPNGAHKKKLALALLSFAVPFALISGSSAITSYIERIASGVTAYLHGWFYPYFSICFILLILTSFALLIYRYAKSKIDLEKRALGLVILALAVPVIMGVLTNLAMPFYSQAAHGVAQRSSLFNIGPASTVFFSGITAYAILRHRLMNIRQIISRGFVSGVVYLVIAAVVLSPGWFFFERIGDSGSSFSLFAFFLVYTGMLLFAARPLNRLGQRVARTVFKRQSLDLFHLPLAQQELLRKAHSAEKLAPLLVSDFQTHLPVEQFVFMAYNHHAGCFNSVYPVSRHVVFAVDDPGVLLLKEVEDVVDVEDFRASADSHNAQRKWLLKKLDHFESRWVLPLHFGERLVGIVFVGRRIDGQPFSVDDEKYLEQFQQQAAQLLWCALQLEYSARQGVERKLMEGVV